MIRRRKKVPRLEPLRADAPAMPGRAVATLPMGYEVEPLWAHMTRAEREAVIASVRAEEEANRRHCILDRAVERARRGAERGAR